MEIEEIDAVKKSANNTIGRKRLSRSRVIYRGRNSDLCLSQLGYQTSADSWDGTKPFPHISEGPKASNFRVSLLVIVPHHGVT